MGNSCNWHNAEACAQLEFFVHLLGRPRYSSRAAGGYAIWTTAELQTRTIFASPIIFDRVMLRDTAQSPCYFTLTVAAIPQSPLPRQMTFDAIDMALTVRADLLDDALVLLYNFLTGKTAPTLAPREQPATRVTQLKPLYAALAPLRKGAKSEHFTINPRCQGACRDRVARLGAEHLVNVPTPTAPSVSDLVRAVSRGSRREHLVDPNPIRDPRFVPFDDLVSYQTDSDIATIDRVYGTTAQRQEYPQYTDFLKYGYTSVPERR